MKRGDGNSLFLLCEECENAWKAPDNVGFATEPFSFEEERINYATIEDIRNLGWDKYKIIEGANPPNDFDPLTYWA
jgi:hypothetical protein